MLGFLQAWSQYLCDVCDILYNAIGIDKYIFQASAVVKVVQCIMQTDAHAISLSLHIDNFFFCSCFRMCKHCWCQFPYWLQQSLCYSLGRGQCDTFLIPFQFSFGPTGQTADEVWTHWNSAETTYIWFESCLNFSILWQEKHSILAHQAAFRVVISVHCLISTCCVCGYRSTLRLLRWEVLITSV